MQTAGAEPAAIALTAEDDTRRQATLEMEPAIQPEEDGRVEDGARETAEDALQQDQLPNFGRPTRAEHGEAVDCDTDPQRRSDPIGVAAEETDDHALLGDPHQFRRKGMSCFSIREGPTGQMNITAS